MPNTIKSLLLSAVCCISLLVVSFVHSCLPVKCKDVHCLNGGTCNGDKCTCPSGYEGNNCENLTRQKFLGNWQQSDSALSAIFPVSITTDTNMHLVGITNFDNYFTQPVKGNVSNANELIIYKQTVQNRTIEGSAAYISSDSITLNYKITDSAGNIKTVKGVWKS